MSLSLYVTSETIDKGVNPPESFRIAFTSIHYPIFKSSLGRY